MHYPEHFIRGITNHGFVDSDGRASAEIFQFDDTGRDDGFCEASINWYDDENALALIMEQRKEKDEQTYQFRYGAAIIARFDADRIMNNALYAEVFRYERAPLDENQYHGNLLRKDSALEKRIRNMIASSLALNAKLIPRTKI
jgi:hypothetical protein